MTKDFGSRLAALAGTAALAFGLSTAMPNTAEAQQRGGARGGTVPTTRGGRGNTATVPAAQTPAKPAPVPSTIKVVSITVSEAEAKDAQARHPGNNAVADISNVDQLRSKVGTGTAIAGRVGVPGVGAVGAGNAQIEGAKQMGQGLARMAGFGGNSNRGADWVVQEKVQAVAGPVVMLYGSEQDATDLKTYLDALPAGTLPKDVTIAYVNPNDQRNSKYDDFFAKKPDDVIVAASGASIVTPAAILQSPLHAVVSHDLEKALNSIATTAPAVAPGVAAPAGPGR